MGNPIQYTSRTFNTILTDINSDPELIDKPNWWKRVWAGVGDVFSMWLNATANNLFLRTSFTRQAVADLLALIDYQLDSQSTSIGDLRFYLNNATIFPVSIAIGDLVALSSGSVAVSAKRFESSAGVVVNAIVEVITSAEINITTDILTVTEIYETGEKLLLSGADLPNPISANIGYFAIYITDTTIKLATSLSNALLGINIDITTTGSGNITIHRYSFEISCQQQESKSNVTIGTSDGSTEFQEFNIPDLNVLKNSISVSINGIAWTKVTTLVNSSSTDKHFLLIYNTNNGSLIKFGNNTYGMIPPAFPILIGYAVGGGVNSNINVANKITTCAGSDSNIESVTNLGPFTGGSNPETIESGKNIAPILLKSRDRFITTEDGEALALGFGGISQVRINKNTFGVLSVQVLTIANGGGNPDTTYKNSLQAYLIDRTLLEEIDVRVQDTTITSTNVTSGAKPLSGYSYANVLPYFRLAWKLLLSEASQEIKDIYTNNGIGDAVTLINTIFSESFTSIDYASIEEQMIALEPRQIGEDLEESTAIGFIDSNVVGLDYFTITAPTFPITLSDDEITTYGTLTLSEIV